MKQLASIGEHMVAVCHSTLGTKGFIAFDLFAAVGKRMLVFWVMKMYCNSIGGC